MSGTDKNGENYYMTNNNQFTVYNPLAKKGSQDQLNIN